jgi:hypothetical protein
VISEKAVKILLKFSAPYLCEKAFSCLKIIKSKDRNLLLSVEEELRVCLSKFRQEFNICENETGLSVTIKANFTDFGYQLYFYI